MTSTFRAALAAIALVSPALALAQADAPGMGEPLPATPQPPPVAPAAPPPVVEPTSPDVPKYVAFRGGVIVPKHDDLDGFDNGFALEGAVGFRVSPRVAVEVSLGRFSMKANVQGDVGGAPATLSAELEAYPILGTLKAFLTEGDLELFGMAGGGFYVMSMKADLNAAGYAPASVSDSNTPFGFHFGGGANVRLSPTTQLGAEVRYLVGKADMFGATFNFDSVQITGGLTFRL
jgi:opacity protein-like surface antigen